MCASFWAMSSRCTSSFPSSLAHLMASASFFARMSANSFSKAAIHLESVTDGDENIGTAPPVVISPKGRGVAGRGGRDVRFRVVWVVVGVAAICGVRIYGDFLLRVFCLFAESSSRALNAPFSNAFRSGLGFPAKKKKLALKNEIGGCVKVRFTYLTR